MCDRRGEWCVLILIVRSLSPVIAESRPCYACSLTCNPCGSARVGHGSAASSSPLYSGGPFPPLYSGGARGVLHNQRSSSDRKGHAVGWHWAAAAASRSSQPVYGQSAASQCSFSRTSHSWIWNATRWDRVTRAERIGLPAGCSGFVRPDRPGPFTCTTQCGWPRDERGCAPWPGPQRPPVGPRQGRCTDKPRIWSSARPAPGRPAEFDIRHFADETFDGFDPVAALRPLSVRFEEAAVVVVVQRDLEIVRCPALDRAFHAAAATVAFHTPLSKRNCTSCSTYPGNCRESPNSYECRKPPPDRRRRSSRNCVESQVDPSAGPTIPRWPVQTTL